MTIPPARGLVTGWACLLPEYAATPPSAVSMGDKTLLGEDKRLAAPLLLDLALTHAWLPHYNLW